MMAASQRKPKGWAGSPGSAEKGGPKEATPLILLASFTSPTPEEHNSP